MRNFLRSLVFGKNPSRKYSQREETKAKLTLNRTPANRPTEATALIVAESSAAGTLRAARIFEAVSHSKRYGIVVATIDGDSELIRLLRLTSPSILIVLCDSTGEICVSREIQQKLKLPVIAYPEAELHGTAEAFDAVMTNFGFVNNHKFAYVLTPYSEANLSRYTERLEAIFDDILGKNNVVSGTEIRLQHFNKILDNTARSDYYPTIREFFEIAPDLMERKIPEANVQQAFVAHTVELLSRKFNRPNLLCVGSHEDSATNYLLAKGFKPVEIDPAINYDLNGFTNLPTTKRNSFEIIYSTSVLEHVTNDEQFISQMCELLTMGGCAVLTCDFNEFYEPGKTPLPETDLRFYTKYDLTKRLGKILDDHGCEVIDAPDWEPMKHDFCYHGIHRYAFATLVFTNSKAASKAI